MKKFFARLHLWLAIPFGIVIMLLCLTGAILVFESEIKEAANPSLYKASTGSGNVLPFGELVEKVKAQLPDTVGISGITVPGSASKNYRLGVAGERRTSIMVDPYTGEVKGVVRPYEKGSFFTFVRRLHRWFLMQLKRDGISWGKMITGVSTLVFVFVLISGIVIWIPRSWKNLKKRFSIKRGAGRFRFWYDVHRSLGKMASLFLLVMALTGLTWSFTWYRNGFYKVFGVEVTQQAQPQQQAAGGQAESAGVGMERSGGRPDGTGNGEDSGREGERQRSGRPDETGQDVSGESRSGRGENRPVEGSEVSTGERRGRRPDKAESAESGARSAGDNTGDARRAGRGDNAQPAESDGTSGAGSTGTESGEVRRGGHRGRREAAVNYAAWQKAAVSVMEGNPGFRSVSVQDGTVSVSVSKYGNTRASDSYSFDGRTGEITGVSWYRDQPRSAKIRGWIYAVHVGSWGGVYTKILYFIACIIGASLPVTGYYIWLKKRWKKWTRNKKSAAAGE